jgi:signal transduction histidine kinase
MKNYFTLIMFCSLFVLGGLAFWQINHLLASQELREEIEDQQLSDKLMQSAIALRKLEKQDDTLSTDPQRKTRALNVIFQQHFKKNGRDYTWDFLNGAGKYLKDLSRRVDTSGYRGFSAKVCTSCLIMIDVLNEDGESAADKSFILNQSPSQMMDIQGIDLAKMKYLHLYTVPKKLSATIYIMPSLFLLSLMLLLIWLLYLNKRQHKLILQKNEFVNHLSHQFQTPLASIKLSANLLAYQKKGEEHELIRIIQTESNRLENHIKTVLHWVKSDAERLQLSKEEIRLTQLVEDSLRQLKPVFIAHKTKVTFIPPADEIRLKADPNHLQLMFFNIWENAIKHNDGPIEMLISCRHENNCIQISSKDDGVGLHRVSEAIKYEGLGLAYIEKLMQLHGGFMELKSIKGKGLDVILNFPSHG